MHVCVFAREVDCACFTGQGWFNIGGGVCVVSDGGAEGGGHHYRVIVASCQKEN